VPCYDKIFYCCLLDLPIESDMHPLHWNIMIQKKD